MQQIDTSRRQRHWDMRAAGNFICGGTGTGLVIVSALWALLPGAHGVPVWPGTHDVPVAPLLAGMLFVMLGLSLVWLEIGKPWRAFNVFFHPRTSWMTREGLLAGPLLACCAAAAALGSVALLLLAAVLAAGFLYCQARMLRASRAIPAWSHPRTVPLIVATALAEGSGVFLLLGGAASAAMVGLALVAALAREVAHEAWHRGLVAAPAPQGTLACLAARGMRVLRGLRWFAALALLTALSMVLFDPGQPGGFGATGALLASAGGVIAAVCGWALKAILVTRAGYTRGPRVPVVPARGRSAARPVLPPGLPGN